MAWFLLKLLNLCSSITVHGLKYVRDFQSILDRGFEYDCIPLSSFLSIPSDSPVILYYADICGLDRYGSCEGRVMGVWLVVWGVIFSM